MHAQIHFDCFTGAGGLEVRKRVLTWLDNEVRGFAIKLVHNLNLIHRVLQMLVSVFALSLIRTKLPLALIQLEIHPVYHMA